MEVDLARTYAAIANLHELLLGMLARGWQSVDLVVERGEGFTRLAKLDVKALGPGTPPPFLGLDQAGTIAAINELLGHMVRDLGDAWTGPRARLSREGATPELVLLDAAGEVQSRFTLDAALAADLLVTDALFGAIDRANGVLDARQQVFEAQTKGFKEWGFDNDTGVLSFVLANGQPLRGPGIVVGSWAKESGTWMWPWGNESAGPKAHAATAPIRDAALDAPGLAALRKRTFPCSLALASHLAVIAASRIGADGVFGGRHPGGVVFIAAMP